MDKTDTAGKSMTKSEIAAALAETVGITKKQATAFLEAQAALAYQQAKHVFTIPGIGKLKLKDQPARDYPIPFGEKKGQIMHKPATKKVRFTLSKLAKDSILAAS